MGSTTVNMVYDKVKAGVSKINHCSTIMDNILMDFERDINVATDDENFQGTAKQELTNSFKDLKREFDSYVNLFVQFAKKYDIAIDFTMRGEAQLQQAAANLDKGPKVS